MYVLIFYSFSPICVIHQATPQTSTKIELLSSNTGISVIISFLKLQYCTYYFTHGIRDR